MSAPGLRGDEAELFRRNNPRLVRRGDAKPVRPTLGREEQPRAEESPWRPRLGHPSPQTCAATVGPRLS